MKKRNDKLGLFKKMGDDYVENLKNLIDVVADFVAEGLSTVTLGMRLGMNAITKWDCKYDS